MQVRPYILIGGKSSRFGSDKAMFEYEGETLAARAARIAESAFPSTAATFVSTTRGSFLDRRMIDDVFPDRGAAGAIHAALIDASEDWIFVLACDLPLVTREFIERLSKLTDGVHGCVIPVQPDGRWQPLCAFYGVDKCLQEFENVITQEGRHASLRAIAEGISPRVVEPSEYEHLPDAKHLLMNANSISDLECI